MTANIFGERFLGKREPAWHGLGQTFDAPIGALEAVETAGLDYQVSLMPLHFTPPRSQKQYPANRNAIVRHPTPDDKDYVVFGQAQDGYGLLQNTQIGQILDPLTEKWPVETVGALGAGETIFFTLDAGSAKVKGEEVKNFFLFTETKDGVTSAKFAFTPVRVVCQNTLVSGLRAAVLNANILHHEDFEADLEWRTKLLLQLQEVQEKVIAAFNELAAKQITLNIAKSIFLAAYPEPRIPDKIVLGRELQEDGEGEWIDIEQKEKWLEYTVNRVAAHREAAQELYGMISADYPKIAGTAWAAYNAVVEVEDFRGKSTDGAKVSAIFGPRAQSKKRAFARALEVSQR